MSGLPGIGPTELLIVALLLLILAAGAAAVLAAVARSARGRSSGRAAEILKERYARGEISQDEFRRMRREIGS